MLIISCNSSFEEAMCDVDCDKIEVLSSHTDDTDESLMTPVAQSIVKELEKLLQKEKERRRVARIVILVTGIMLVVSVVLIAVSLYMAKDIDELAQSDVEELEKLVQKEKERKRVARVVALVSGILLIISVVLVAVTLYRSKDIDELVRNSNEMLRRHNDRMSQGTQLREQHTLPATVNVTLQH